MPIKLVDLKKNTRDLCVPMFGDAVKLTYRPLEFTPALESELCEHEGAISAAYAQLLCRVLASWDIEGEKGKAVPITPEGISQVPSQVLKQLVTAVVEDLKPAGESPSA